MSNSEAIVVSKNSLRQHEEPAYSESTVKIYAVLPGLLLQSRKEVQPKSQKK